MASIKRSLFLVCVILIWGLIGCASQQKQRFIYPTVSGYTGSKDFPKYNSIAVLPFSDAPYARHSGQIVQGLAIQLFAKNGFSVMERSRFSNILDEQAMSLSGLMDDQQSLKLGKMLGVKAIVVGAVGQYQVVAKSSPPAYIPLFGGGIFPVGGGQWNETYVSISLRIIDVETGQLIYSGSGQYSQPVSIQPQTAGLNITSCIILRWLGKY